MNFEKFFYDILIQLANPSRVQVLDMDGYFLMMSKNNTNDTWGWYYINSQKLEDYLKNNGYKWHYVFEKYDDEDSYIYLYIGKNLSHKDVCEMVKEYEKKYPNSYFVESGNFNSFDKSKYERKLTVFEETVIRMSGNVFTIHEA